jgi:hypothetical protein
MRRELWIGLALLAVMLPACGTKKHELILDPDVDVSATNRTKVAVIGSEDELLGYEYAAIYSVMRAGDAALDAGSLGVAKDYYTQALQRLRLLRQTHPRWNTDILDFRMDYCRERLQVITARSMPQPTHIR